MTTWLLSIAGVVIVGALVEVLLSDSSVHKFIRSIYAFFILFVIAQPIPGFFRNTVNSIETGGGITLNQELMASINAQTAAAMQRNAQVALETAGFDGVIVTIHSGKIYINAFGVVLRHINTDITIEDEIIKIVRAVTNAPREVIYYVGV
jgi:hypothetical protein